MRNLMQLRINSVTIPKPTVALLWAVGLLLSVLLLNNRVFSADEQETSPPEQEVIDDETTLDENVIDVKHADRFEQREREGLTIFIGNVQIERPNGFLNADKVTIYENVETNETVKTVSEGNVELRDRDIFVTCAHAILNHLTDVIEFSEDVIVLQNEDRLEADKFWYNRRTGERWGEGNIKVRFRVKSQKASESDSQESDLQESEEVESSGGPSNP
jgi:lipopolysaccharide export system protein LptA